MNFNNIIKLFFALAISVSIEGCTSYGYEPDDNGNSGGNGGSINTLTGTRWSDNFWDYSIGDDWVATHEGGRDVIFLSDTEGVEYIWSKDNYSDIGDNHSRYAGFFTYEIKGNNVYIDPIGYLGKEISSYFEIKDGKLVSGTGMTLSKKTLDSNTRNWINSIHGTTGDCKWYYDLMGTLSIVGKGKMADYNSFEATPWSKLTKYHALNSVYFGEDVKHIGAYAFAYKPLGNIYSQFVGELVMAESIGQCAFKGSSLKTATIIHNLKTIGDSAFDGCSYLTDFTVSSKVETVGNYAFNGCKSAYIKNATSLKKIGDFAFAGCEIEYFTDSQVLEEIGNTAFTNLKIAKLEIPYSVNKIGNFAFCGSFSEIRLSKKHIEVTGTPFSGASSGSVYTPTGTEALWKSDSGKLVDDNHIQNWKLYVPVGSQKTYSNNIHYKGFKEIIEDPSL